MSSNTVCPSLGRREVGEEFYNNDSRTGLLTRIRVCTDPILFRYGLRWPGEVSITSDMQMTPPLWEKVKRNSKAF